MFAGGLRSFGPHRAAPLKSFRHRADITRWRIVREMGNSATTYRLRASGLTWRTVGDMIIVLDLESSNYLSIGGAGISIWTQLATGATATELAAMLTASYEIENVDAAQDVDTFLARLVERRLVVTDVQQV